MAKSKSKHSRVRHTIRLKWLLRKKRRKHDKLGEVTKRR